MEGHIHHVDHHNPAHTKKELNKKNRNIWRILGSFLLDMLPIIFGILIAIGINSIRERNHTHDLEKFYLSNIKKNIDENVKDLQFDVKYFEEISDARKFFISDTVQNDSAKIKKQFYKFFYLVQPQLNNSAFITLQNTGKLDIISNFKIIENLTQLYEVDAAILHVMVNDYNQKYNNLFLPYLINENMDHSIFKLNSTETKALTSTVKFRSIVSLFTFLGGIVNKYNDIIAEHNILSKQIGDELCK